MKDPVGRELSDMHAEHLNFLCSMDSQGAHIAVPAALHYCARYGIAPPEWSVRRASELFCQLLNPTKSKKRGRSAGIVERYRQDMIDHIRFETISDFLRQRVKCDEVIKELSGRETPAAKKMLAQFLAKRKTLGKSQKDLFDLASAALGGAAAGGRDAMDKAYQRVKRRSVRWDRYRYYKLDTQFLRAIGAYVEPWGHTGKKPSI